MPEPARIFISYARSDSASLASRLYRELQERGYDVWLDSDRLAGSAVWSVEIERALDASGVILALLSQGSYVSDICRAEQLRSLRRGKCVIPVLAQHGADRPLHLENRQYRDLSDEVRYSAEFSLLLGDIRLLAGSVLVERFRQTYITVPPLPVNYVERPADLAMLRSMVVSDAKTRQLALTAGEGMGGSWKKNFSHAPCLYEG